jgi:hypothetical protein
MTDLTTEQLQERFDNPEYWDLAKLWMEAKALAETVREKVDAIRVDVLKNDVKLYNDLDMSFKERQSSRFKDIERKRILDPKEDYQTQDDDEQARYYALLVEKTRAAGLRTPDMTDDQCPALVAEYDLVKVEWLILDALNIIFETDQFSGIYDVAAAGKFNRTNAIDLFIKCAHNHPNNTKRGIVAGVKKY